jgi:hypothetical protein
LTSVSEARSRRFPPVSGPYGWAGAALFVAGAVCEVVAVFAVMAAAFNSDLRQAAPWFVLFVVSLPLFAAGAYLWRLGSKRAGTLSPNPVPNERRTALLRAASVIVLGSVIGFGGFLYLAFALQGTRRLAFALAALIAGTAISEVGTKKMYKVLGRPVPSLFLGSSRRSSVLFFAVLLLEAALLLIGLLWPDLIPTP